MDPNFDRDRERSKPDSWKYDLVCDVAKGAAVQNESPRQSLKYGSFGVTLTSNTAIRSLSSQGTFAYYADVPRT